MKRLWLVLLFGLGFLLLGTAIFAGGLLALERGNAGIKSGTGSEHASSKSLPVEGQVILIDPGHGGFDPGKVQGDVMEKDLNLTLSIELKQVLEDRGFRVFLTRETDTDFRSGETLRAWKRADLKARRDLAETVGATVFLSIHMNSYDETTRGAQVFYSRDKDLAQSLQAAIRDTADPANHRTAQAADYYVLAENPVPAALIEAGFLSCPGDLERLMDPGYRQALCRGICRGLLSYLSGQSL